MTAIVIIAFAAHVIAWIVLPTSKSKSKRTAAAAAVPQPSAAMRMSSI